MSSNEKAVKDQERLEALKELSSRKIERLAFSGGGAKGVVYNGAYWALRETGVLKGVEKIAGTSVGAFTATLVALNMPAKVFRDTLLDTNLKELLGEPVLDVFGKNEERVYHVFGKNKGGISFITRDGKPLEKLIRDSINLAAKAAISELNKNKDVEDLELQALFLRISIQEDPGLTFSDLALLHKHFPGKFKELTISATRFPNGELQIFSAETTPDVEIAIACRASASIPVILEPVQITINGEEHTFVDGGLQDNLLTEYFDFDKESKEFLENTKRRATLVFAFGEHSNEENPVFQLLYGKQWDEALANETLENIIEQAVWLVRDFTPKRQLSVLKGAVQAVLNKKVKDGEITKDEAAVIGAAMKKVELSQPLQNDGSIPHLANLLKEKLKPVLYEAGFIERIKRNFLVEALGDLRPDYKNTEKKALGYQKLRKEYALRTVELRVGDIGTMDFEKASKSARVMDALGYLDTINYMTNHELDDPHSFDEQKFYVDLVKNFEQIYQAVLLGAGKDPQKDALMQAIDSLRRDLLNLPRKDNSEAAINRQKAVISRQIYQLIKDKVESKLDSSAAFALSRAVEYHNGVLSANELFKETYMEAFKRSGVFATSNITGKLIFSRSTLAQALNEQSMFALHQKRSHRTDQNRIMDVFRCLRGLDGFQEAAQEVSDGSSDTGSLPSHF